MSKIKEIYTEILIGKSLPFEAADILRKCNKVIADEDEAEVFPKYVISKINSYLKDEINEEQLSEWAAFIVIMEGFVTPHWKDNYDLADRYEFKEF